MTLEEMKSKVNQMRREQNLKELTTEQLNSLTEEELKEELHMLKINPEVTSIWNKTQELLNKAKNEKKD